MILGDGIRLRAPERVDIPRWVAWLNDPEVIADLVVVAPMSTEEEIAWFEAMLKRPVEERPLVIEVQQGEDWRPVGNIGYHTIDWRNRWAEVGIFIGEKALWSKGIGTRAMRLFLKYGFETLNLHRVELRVNARNVRAIRSYEKAGFRHEGALRERAFLDGGFGDLVLMGILEAEWRSQSG